MYLHHNRLRLYVDTVTLFTVQILYMCAITVGCCDVFRYRHLLIKRMCCIWFMEVNNFLQSCDFIFH